MKQLYILLLPACLLTAIGCKDKHGKIKPSEEPITESVYASGIIKSADQYQAYSQANGLVKEVFAEEGDLVKKGQPIMQLSDITARLNTANARIAAAYASVNENTEKLKEARLEMESARAKMITDSSLLNKQRNLWKESIGTKIELEQRELAYTNSRNTYNAARLQYADLVKQMNLQEQKTRNDLQISASIAGDYIIKSEVDGKIYSILKEKGEMVNSQTPVAIIGKADSFLLELQVDEFDIASIQPGQQVLLNMDSYKDTVFEARVSKVNPIMNSQSKSFTVEAQFVTHPPVLYPNLTLEANIIIRVKEKAITIPRNYLIDEQYVLLPDKSKKKVITGLKDYRKVEIVGGLSANDEIIKPEP